MLASCSKPTRALRALLGWMSRSQRLWKQANRLWPGGASSTLRRGLRQPSTDVHLTESTVASWTESRRHGLWRWPAASHQKAKPAGVYDYWPTSWLSLRSSKMRSPTRLLEGLSKKRTEATPEKAVVDPAALQRRVCVAHGGCAGCLHSAL